MIPSNTTNSTTGYTKSDGVSFSIDDEDMAFIFGILRNNMYSNPIKICVQEPLCNGRDAARQIGNVIKPMEVTLPDADNEFFIVRDFGPSLTYDQMVNVFCKYGKSTKRGTNQTGGFGIGAKSPWAYSNEFFVDTFIDGEKTSYRFYIDSDTEKGKMEVLTVSKVDTENGLKVMIPVKPGDETEFVNNYEFITRYWGVKPKVLNCSIDYRQNDVLIEDEWILYEQCGAFHSAGILVDDIPYPIDVSSFEIPEHLQELARLPIHLFCGCDDVNVAASREQLNYTKKTIDYLLNEFQKAYDTCKQILEDRINKCSTFPEAYAYWKGEDTRLKNIFESITWRGHELNIGKKLRSLPYVDKWGYSKNRYETKIYHIVKASSGKGFYERSKEYLDITKPIIVCLKDNKRIPPSKVRNALYWLQNKNNVEEFYLIHFPDDKDCEEKGKRTTELWKHLKEECNWSLLDTYNIDDFKSKPKEKNKKGSSAGYGKLNVIYRRIDRLQADIESLEGVYCEGKYNAIDLYQTQVFKDIKECSLTLLSINQSLRLQTILVIPSKHMKEAKKNTKLISFCDFIENAKDTIFDKDKCERIAHSQKIGHFATRASGIFPYRIMEVLLENLDKLSPSCELRTFLECYKNDSLYTTADGEYLRDMRNIYGYEFEKDEQSPDSSNEDFEKLRSHIISKYKLLSFVNAYHPNEFMDHIMTYINAVDGNTDG